MALSARTRRTLPFLLTALVTMWLVRPATAQGDGWRTIEFETTEVTAPDVAITPDGQSLIFTLLGHLFRLPVEGGDAEQLTFGPYYDARPAVSPDGALVAFQSDRDGSEGNIFVLGLATGEITQLTDEPWADSPSWAPDGQSVVYLQLVREAWNAWNPRGEGPNRNPRHQPPPAMVRRVRLGGGEPETIRAEMSEIRSPFHMPDGRVGWGVVERDRDSPRVTTRIEVRDRDGTVSTQLSLDGVAQAIVASGEEFFLRRHIPVTIGGRAAQQREIVRVPRAGGQERPVVPVSYARALVEPRFALSGDDATLYVGDLGRLWKVTLARNRREAIPFRARVRMEARDPTPPPKWTLPEPRATRPPTSIQYPRLSPDGQRLFFVAARLLWEQPLDGGPIRQLTRGITVDPAVSPDGSRVAFLRGGGLWVFDLASEQVLTVLRPQARVAPTWTRDGQALIVWEEASGGESFRLLAVDLSGAREVLTEVPGQPTMHTAISPEGQWLYFVAEEAPDSPTVFRLSLLDRGVPPEPVTQLAIEFEYGRVSPDGQWFVYRPRNKLAIRVVPLGGERVSAEDSRLLSPVGGNTAFAFTHDGSAVVYAGAGNSVWHHPLNGDEREEIPVRLELQRPAPPPLLLRRVRMLDLGIGSFGTETSVLIEEGRIRWTGTERELSPGTVTLDAGGRFAIPGLFDMHAHNASACRGARGRDYLAHGVTSVRNMGGIAVEISQAADREFTGYGSPRCYYAGYLIEGEQGRSDGHFIHPTDEADARAQVRLMHSWGASFIKLYQVLPWALHRAAADEARQLGLPVVSHGWFPEQVIRGVTLGGLLTHGPQKAHDDLFQLLLAMGTRTDPVLGAHAGRWVLRRREPERFSGPQEIHPVGDDALEGFFAAAVASVKQRYDLGITLLPGTDWGTGWALQVELEFFAEAGIPPLDILRFATQASAETVGAGDDLGTLEVGKLADIVLLDANPLEDIKNTQSIWRVIKGGFVFDPDELRPERR